MGERKSGGVGVRYTRQVSTLRRSHRRVGACTGILFNVAALILTRLHPPPPQKPSRLVITTSSSAASSSTAAAAHRQIPALSKSGRHVVCLQRAGLWRSRAHGRRAAEAARSVAQFDRDRPDFRRRALPTSGGAPAFDLLVHPPTPPILLRAHRIWLHGRAARRPSQARQPSHATVGEGLSVGFI